MDSAKFIRKRSVLIAWLAVPLLLAGLLDRFAYSFLERQRLSYVRNKTLERIIPKMARVAGDFDEFIRPYRKSSGSDLSSQDKTIELLNQAAATASLTLTSINLKEETPDLSPDCVRINFQIKGEGTPREIGAFLNKVKTEDPQIYESRIVAVHDSRNLGKFQLEAVLSKVHLRSLRGEP